MSGYLYRQFISDSKQYTLFRMCTVYTVQCGEVLYALYSVQWIRVEEAKLYIQYRLVFSAVTLSHAIY